MMTPFTGPTCVYQWLCMSYKNLMSRDQMATVWIRCLLLIHDKIILCPNASVNTFSDKI